MCVQNIKLLIVAILVQAIFFNSAPSLAGEGVLTVHLLMKDGSREEATFEGFDSICDLYGDKGIRYSAGMERITIPWDDVGYVIPLAGAVKPKQGKQLIIEALKPGPCSESYITGSRRKKVKLKGFKKERLVNEKIKIAISDIKVLTFGKLWLSKGVEASGKLVSEEMVLIKGDCFKMGDASGSGESDEISIHEVCIDDFYLGRYEIRQREWKEVMGNNPSHFKNCVDCPVEDVSWNEVQDFIKKLNKNKGQNYRLPTEAEWEYAARSGGRDKRWAGTGSESELEDYAWYGSNSESSTHPVGMKKPNELGIYDISGNVWEWVSDWYGADSYGRTPKKDLKGPSKGKYKVLRGGGFYNELAYTKTTFRFSAPSDYRDSAIGFRLARTP